jgi:phosphatidylglycerol:prolipoprotein diacylglycerol transferase
MLDFIIWDVAPEIFTIPQFSVSGLTFGPRPIVWYGLLFAMGFLIGQQIFSKIYKIEGKPQKQVEILTIYMIVATIVGARLGHCIFYEPNDFFWEPAKLIRIFYIWEGGLASHGAGIAILIALWLYCKRYPFEKYLRVLDRIAIIVALAACFIRFGNLMNSEIIGKPTSAAQGFVFIHSTTSNLEDTFGGQVTSVKVKENGTDSTFDGKYLTGVDIRMKVISFGNGDIREMAENNIKSVLYAHREYGEHIILSRAKESVLVGNEGREGTDVIIKAWAIPRHPSQLYESISSLFLFFLLIFIYSRYTWETPEGLLFGIFMIWIFTLRFFYEFLKENQVAFENDMTLNMGQILSIPMIIIGIIVFIRSLRLPKIEY